MPGAKAENAFDRFRELARKLAAVPKREADERRADRKTPPTQTPAAG